MTTRRLYIAAYDVRSPSRLARALQTVRAHASGGQYSAYECWLDRAEREALEAAMAGVLDTTVDSFVLVPIASRQAVRILGVAVAPADPDLYYFG